MKKLKILWFNWRCWINPSMGGAEVFTKEVAKRWVETGHEVTLFTSTFPDCKREEVSEGVRIVRAGGRFSVYRQAKKFYQKRFESEGFDLIIDEINTVPFFAPKFVKREKVIAFIHQLAREYWFYEIPFPISYLGFYFLEDHWLKNYKDLPTVTVSDSTRLDLANIGFNYLYVVPEGLNFVPVDNIPFRKGSKPIVVFAGRLKRAKRPDHAIRAFKIVKCEIPEAELWVIGEGPFKSKLEGIAGDGVTFFGGLDSSERREKIKSSWILVNPSVREGWGLNIVEANALGVPAVAYDVHGLCDSVKDNETGLLAKDGEVIDLAEKIIALLKNEELLEKLSRKALTYSRNFSWDKTAAEFMLILEKCLRGCSKLNK